jgi:transcriptional regulator with XRE-family HTH domain
MKGGVFMVTDKIKALLMITGKKQVDLANEFGLTAQSMSNKMTLNRYNADDLIKIAEFTGCKVGFLLPNGEHILLEASDIREKKKPE